MINKTVIKKAMKNVYLDFENTEVQKAYIESNQDVEFDNVRQTTQEYEEVEAFDFVDVDYTEVDNETGEIEEVIVEFD